MHSEQCGLGEAWKPANGGRRSLGPNEGAGSTLREGVNGTGGSSCCRSSSRWRCSCERSSALRETFSGIGMASDAHAAAHSRSTSCAAQAGAATEQPPIVLSGKMLARAEEIFIPGDMADRQVVLSKRDARDSLECHDTTKS